MKKPERKTDFSSMLPLAKRLKGIRLFRGMTEAEIAEVLVKTGARTETFERGAMIVFEGTKAKWVGAVLSGRADMHMAGLGGESHLVRVIPAGELFGESLLTSHLEYYPGMVTAVEPSEVVFLEIAKICAIWREPKYAKLFENLYSIVSVDAIRYLRKLSILSCKRVEDRIMMYFCWLASECGERDVTVPFPTMEACAEYLGVTRTAMSLALKHLTERGILAHPDRARFVIRAR